MHASRWKVVINTIQQGFWSTPGDDTPLYKPYRYMPPQRVWFLCRFGPKTGMGFAHFGMESGVVFKGTMGVCKRICRFNSELIRKKESWKRPKFAREQRRAIFINKDYKGAMLRFFLSLRVFTSIDFSKIMTQFCCWRLYLDIELIPVTNLIGLTSSIFLLCLPKNHKTVKRIRALWWNFTEFDIFFTTPLEHFFVRVFELSDDF